MSEDHGHIESARHEATAAVAVAEPHVQEPRARKEPRHNHEAHEHAPPSTSEPWGARVLFGFAGLVLLAGAAAAWQFKGMLGGEVGQALPWIIAAAVLLGGAAIVESISTPVWISLIAGVFLLAITFVVAGRVANYTVGQSIFVVDRFTGEVELCNSDACTVLPRHGSLFYPLPKLPSLPIHAK